MICCISNSRFNCPLPLDWIIVPLLWVLVLSTPHSESGFWYPIGQLLFEIPHLSNFVFNTPLSDFRFSYPYALFSFSIPLSWNLVFWTLCVNFVVLFLNVYYIMQKIVKFLSEMSVFCQNLWYNVCSDISRGGTYKHACLWVLFPKCYFLLSYSW